MGFLRRDLVSGGFAPSLVAFLTSAGYRVEFLTDGRTAKGQLIAGGSGSLTNGGTGTTGTARGRSYLSTVSTAGFPDPGTVNYSATDYWSIPTITDATLNPLTSPITCILCGQINYYSSPGVSYGTYNGYPDGHGVHWGNAADLQIAVGSQRALNSGLTFGARIQNINNNHGLATKHATTNGAVSSGSGGSPFSYQWSQNTALHNTNGLYYLSAYRLSPTSGLLRDCLQIIENNDGTFQYGAVNMPTVTAPAGAFVAPSSTPIIQIGPCYQGNAFPSMNKRTRTCIAAFCQGYITDAHLRGLLTLIKLGVPG